MISSRGFAERTVSMKIDLHTPIVPAQWEDWAEKYGGGRWPRLVPRDACHATIMTGDQFFRDVTDQSWSPERRIEDMDRLGIDHQVLSPPPVMLCYWADPIGFIAQAGFDAATVAAIEGENAVRFLGR